MRTTPRVWAHRGASAARPENTVDAFVEAARLGADGVELDVRRSADHALVVHHDAQLPDGRLVKDVTVADLPAHVPLLDAALEACGPAMTVNVEIKNWPDDPDYDAEAAIVAPVLAAIADQRRRIVVSCFDLETLDRVGQADPEVRRGYLTSVRWDQLECLRLAIEHGHHAVHPHHVVVNAELVAAAHDAGVAVHTWTADDPDRIRWLADVGVDAVITNVPDVALAALSA